MFGGKKPSDDGDDETSDMDVDNAKSTALDSMFDALHAKDRDGFKKAWGVLHGGDDEDPEEKDDKSKPTADIMKDEAGP